MKNQELLLSRIRSRGEEMATWIFKWTTGSFWEQFTYLLPFSSVFFSQAKSVFHGSLGFGFTLSYATEANVESTSEINNFLHWYRKKATTNVNILNTHLLLSQINRAAQYLHLAAGGSGRERLFQEGFLQHEDTEVRSQSQWILLWERTILATLSVCAPRVRITTFTDRRQCLKRTLKLGKER